MMHNIKTGKIDFTLKKKGFLGMGRSNLETTSVPLTALGAHSNFTKAVSI